MRWKLWSLSLLPILACAPEPKYSVNIRKSMPEKSLAEIESEIQKGQEQQLMVVLRTEAVLPLQLSSAPLDEAARPFWLARRAALFAEARQDIWQGTLKLGVKPFREYDHLPLASVRVNSVEGLKALANHPQVLAVHEDRAHSPSLVESLPLIQQALAAADGKTGLGTSVAVLDTGADYKRADLGSCTAVGQPASCRVAYAQDFGTNDNLLDDAASGLHGTNVSAIVAKVAPGTKILALDVFRSEYAYTSDIVAAINWAIANKATYNIAALNLSLGGGKSTSPCPSDAMSVAIKNAKDAGILSAVASGNESYTDGLSYPACSPDAISVGAVYDSSMGSLNWGCVDVTAPDKITCFSNSASFLTMLAPGSQIFAAGINMSGTSQASPHVAGAIAVLRGAYPEETIAQLQTRLTSTGTTLLDSRNNVSKPRLNLAAAAAGSCSFSLNPGSGSISPIGGEVSTLLSTGGTCAWNLSSDSPWLSFPGGSSGTGPSTLKFLVEASDGNARSAMVTLQSVDDPAISKTFALQQFEDKAAPTGTLRINEGSGWTRARTVALAINAQDPSGVAEMCISEGDSCSSFEPYATAKVWTLSESEGSKTVRVFLKDQLGNISTAANALGASISLDMTVPTDGTLLATAASSSLQVALSWSGFSDALSPVTYKLVVGTAGAVPASCSEGSTLYTGTATSFTHSNLTAKTSYGYRLCAIDAAGNNSLGALAQATTVDIDKEGPIGSIKINSDAAYTRTTAVTLQLSASDPSGVSQMCISQTTSCTSWETYSVSKAYTLVNTQGTRTVYASFRDKLGNVSASVQDSIVYDSVAPTMGRLSVSSVTRNSMVVSWTSASDAVSGLAGYKLVYRSGTTYPNAGCTNGTVVPLGASNQVTVSGLSARTTYSFRLCASDKAGNNASGITIRGTTLR